MNLGLGFIICAIKKVKYAKICNENIQQTCQYIPNYHYANNFRTYRIKLLFSFHIYIYI
jgi:hypothetical protein